ncbi:unnamed protein product [Adineta steineri]|uniref:AMOP domain-containing protein n=1 Tax=Adineta steineri TaxID=433720 RepID=A0A815ULP6_9BILA|nr:unnamed protein product [Adineta steineri]CAF1518856.1 unnamed protein product [Adineta steineri]
MKSISLALFGLFTVLFINGLPFNVKSNDGSDCNYISATDPCDTWYKQQGNSTTLVDGTPKPPCQISKDFTSPLPNVAGNWITDETCNPKQIIGKCLFHPGAYGCYRSCVGTTGPSGQACYDINGKFIEQSQPGAGSVDAETICGNSLPQGVKHFCADVLPYILCCEFPGTSSPDNCNKYNQARPVGTCQGTSAF